MTAQAPLVFTAGGTVAVLTWLLALSWYARHMVRIEGATVHPPLAHLITCLGLLIGMAGWGGYAALTWSQIPWRVAILPPVALAALMAHTLWTRRLTGSFLSLWWYSCAIVAYGTTLVSFWIRDLAGALIIPPAFILLVIHELTAVVAAGALMVYSLALLVRRYPIQASGTRRAEHWGDGAMRAALVSVTLTLSAAAWRAWSAWGEVARADVAMSFTAWALVMAASWWQMMTGMTTTRIVHGLALSALGLLIVMLILVV